MLAITENGYGVILSFKLNPPCSSAGMFECAPSPAAENLGFIKLCRINVFGGLYRTTTSRKSLLLRRASWIDECSRKYFKPIKAKDDSHTHHCAAFSGKNLRQMSNVGKSTNILWHDCPIQKHDRQQLLQQKGCVIWLTGLSGSGKSTLACALSRSLHSRGKLTYILDGDNIRHGLNRDLSFRMEDRSENIRRIGEFRARAHTSHKSEVAKLFADAGVICITSLISPYQKDRDACRALLPEGDFIEVFIDVPLQVCEARDPKGLYKLARAGKITGFTGIDDPYEPPCSCEIVLKQKGSDCMSPNDMAAVVISYLEEKGYLRA